MSNWCVYILLCKDKTLYTGITNDLELRIRMHNQGKASKYTRVRLPIKVVYQENGMTRSEALSREYAIKKLPRKQKLLLIKQL